MSVLFFEQQPLDWELPPGSCAQELDLGLATTADCFCSDWNLATTNAGGMTPWARAQAIFCASLWQQHFSQHCAAVLHPQGLSMHGNSSVPEISLMGGGAGNPMMPANMQPSNANTIKRAARLVDTLVKR